MTPNILSIMRCLNYLKTNSIGGGGEFHYIVQAGLKLCDPSALASRGWNYEFVPTHLG